MARYLHYFIYQYYSEISSLSDPAKQSVPNPSSGAEPAAGDMPVTALAVVTDKSASDVLPTPTLTVVTDSDVSKAAAATEESDTSNPVT
jgi:hypothetical protein